MSVVRSLILSGFFAATFSWAVPAQAASVACDATTAGLVTPNIGCEVLTSADNDSEAAVDGMFNVSGWDLIGKVEGDPFAGGTDNGLTITGDAEGGTWSVAASILSTYQNVMLIFKGGDGALPEAVVGYLINASPGEYDSPFYQVQGGSGPNAGTFTIKDISHVSLYVADMVPVPVPAAGFLLVGALAGFGAVARKKKKAAAQATA